jgi:hypothetical protein
MYNPSDESIEGAVSLFCKINKVEELTLEEVTIRELALRQPDRFNISVGPKKIMTLKIFTNH